MALQTLRVRWAGWDAAVNLIGIIGMSDADWFEARLLEFGVGSKGIYRAEGNTGVTASVSMVDDRSFFTFAGANEKLMDILRSTAMVALVEACAPCALCIAT